MKAYNYSKIKPVSIERLVKICTDIKDLTLKQSVEYGLGIGLTKHNIENLRQMLGYCGSGNVHKFTIEQREAIAREYQEDDEITMQELAKKYGVHYNSIRCILMARDVTIRNPRKWSRRQEMYLIAEHKRGVSIRKIASAMGKSRNSIAQKLQRLVRDGIIPKEKQ